MPAGAVSSQSEPCRLGDVPSRTLHQLGRQLAVRSFVEARTTISSVETEFGEEDCFLSVAEHPVMPENGKWWGGMGRKMVTLSW